MSGATLRGQRPSCILVADETFARRNKLVEKIQDLGLDVERLVEPRQAKSLDASGVHAVVLQVDGLGHSETANVQRVATAGGAKFFTINHQRSSGRWQRLVEYAAEARAASPASARAPEQSGVASLDDGRDPRDAELAGLRLRARALEADAARVPELAEQASKLQAELRAARESATAGAGSIELARREVERLTTLEAARGEQVRELGVLLAKRAEDVDAKDAMVRKLAEDLARSDEEVKRLGAEAAGLRNARAERDDVREKLAAEERARREAAEKAKRAEATLVEARAALKEARAKVEALESSASAPSAAGLEESSIEALRTLARGEVMTWEEAFAKLAAKAVRS